MSLTPMVNVHPFDLAKYQQPPEASPGPSGDAAPVFSLRVLPERGQDQENQDQAFTLTVATAGYKSPLVEVDTRSADNVMVFQQPRTSDAVTNLKRKKFFRDEELELECEWEDCVDSFQSEAAFTCHVSGHVTEAEVRHLEPPLEDVFGCLWKECGFESPSSEEMVRHINFHSFHTKIKCHGRNTVSQHGMAACALDPGQRNIVPELAEAWQCQWAGCPLAASTFSQPSQFYTHVTAHAEEARGKEVRCRWGDCSSRAGSVSKLKEHMRAHTQEKMIGCPNCGALFSNRVKFLDHCKRQQMSEEDAFKCNNCGKKFALERLLRDHMRSHINHYKCPQCDMTCPTPSTLARHIRYKHIGDKPFQCNFCDYLGKTQNDVKGHMKIHIEEPEFKCMEPGCGYICRAQVTLKKHFLKKHQKSSVNNYACHLCDKRYNRGAFLTKHLMKSHNFSWPSGHSRFRYVRDDVTGLHRLQTIRFESLDLQEELQGSDSLRIADSEVDPAESVRSVSPGSCAGGGGGLSVRTSSPLPFYSVARSPDEAADEVEAGHILTSLLSQHHDSEPYIVKYPIDM